MGDVVDLGSVGVQLPLKATNSNTDAFDAYSQIQAVNWSTIKLIATSPKLCRYRAEKPETDKIAYRKGRLIHVATLEPDRWAREYVIEPDFGPHYTDKGELATNPKSTKSYKTAYKAWRESLDPNALIVSPEERAMGDRCAAAIREHRITGPLLDGAKCEQVITWTDPETGIKCKGRVDMLKRCVIDLKGTRRDNVRRFIWDTAEWLYYAQVCWYQWGAVCARLLPPDGDYPLAIGVQMDEPHDVIPLRMTSETFEAGNNLFRSLLDRYVECQQADWWPGLCEDFVEWTLPPYALGLERQPDGDAW